MMNCAMTFTGIAMAETGDTVLSFFTCKMIRPAPLAFRCAGRVVFKVGRIQSSELIYDARVLPPMN